MAETALPQFIDDTFDDEQDEHLLEQRAVERRRLFTATIDTYLVLVVGILVAIGLIMVWSTTFFWSDPQSAIFLQQLRNAVIGIVVMFVLSLINYRLWRRLSIPLMAVTIIALIGVLMLGESVFGAKRAFFEGAVQPSEVAVLSVIIYMAAWMSSKKDKLKRLTYGLLPFALLVGFIAGLIILEPHLSTAALILITASIMFFLAGAEWKQILTVLAAFAFAGIIAISQFDYAQARVESFRDLLVDPLLASDHTQSAIYGFLRGGLSGVGLGEGYQKFAALPAPHTDSIFAVIGEELGLVGCGLVISLYVIFLLRGYRISRKAPELVWGAAGGRHDHGHRGGSDDEHRCHGCHDAFHRCAAALHQLWRLVAGVLAGGGWLPVEHLAGDHAQIRLGAQSQRNAVPARHARLDLAGAAARSGMSTASPAPPLTILVSAGGTGGGVYPALTVVDALRRRAPGCRVHFVGSRGGMESKLVPRDRVDGYHTLRSGPIHGVSLLRRLVSAVQILLGIGQAWNLARRLQPDVLFLTGGWVTFPAAVGCWLRGVPIAIYVPDIEPALANKVLSRIARLVMTPVEESRAFFPKGTNVVRVGYPLRDELLAASREDGHRPFWP